VLAGTLAPRLDELLGPQSVKEAVRAVPCGMRVGDQVRCWEEGKAILFDDCYEHEVGTCGLPPLRACTGPQPVAPCDRCGTTPTLRE
jgi:hypothetical protein